MTNKTMPGVIYLQPNAGIDGETTWCDGSQFDDDVEYVRADIAAGDPNEPLADGQYRWARYTRFINGRKEWEVVKIFSVWDGDLKVMIVVDFNGEESPDSEYEFGPVIRLPEEQ